MCDLLNAPPFGSREYLVGNFTFSEKLQFLSGLDYYISILHSPGNDSVENYFN